MPGTSLAERFRNWLGDLTVLAAVFAWGWVCAVTIFRWNLNPMLLAWVTALSGMAVIGGTLWLLDRNSTKT